MSTTTSIPTSPSVVESAIIPASLAETWDLIRLLNFQPFWTTVERVNFLDVSDDDGVIKWTFKDGTVYELKLEEKSHLNHYVTYSVISATPALTYSSVISTVRCLPVTSGAHQGSTFVQWSASFSSDADAGVIEDAKYKRREALADLAAFVSKAN